MGLRILLVYHALLLQLNVLAGQCGCMQVRSTTCVASLSRQSWCQGKVSVKAKSVSRQRQCQGKGMLTRGHIVIERCNNKIWLNTFVGNVPLLFVFMFGT